MVSLEKKAIVLLTNFLVCNVCTIYNVFVLKADSSFVAILLIGADVFALLIDGHQNRYHFLRQIFIVVVNNLFFILGSKDLVWLNLVRGLCLFPTETMKKHRWIVLCMQIFVLLPFLLAGVWYWIACPFPSLLYCSSKQDWVHYDLLEDADNSHVILIRSVYFIMESLTTVGFGDILPHNFREKLFCLLLLFISTLFWSGINALVITANRWVSINSLVVTEEVAALKSWLHTYSLPIVAENLLVSHKLHFPGGLSAESLWHQLPISIPNAVMGNQLANLFNVDRELSLLCTKDVLSCCLFVNYMRDMIVYNFNSSTLFFVLDGTIREENDYGISRSSIFGIIVRMSDFVKLHRSAADVFDEFLPSNHESGDKNKAIARQKALFLAATAAIRQNGSRYNSNLDRGSRKFYHSIYIGCLISMIFCIFLWIVVTPFVVFRVFNKVRSEKELNRLTVVDLGLVCLYIASRALSVILFCDLGSLYAFFKMRRVKTFDYSLFCWFWSVSGEIIALIPCYVVLYELSNLCVYGLLCCNRFLLFFRLSTLLSTTTQHFESSSLASIVQSRIIETVCWFCLLVSSLVCCWVYFWSDTSFTSAYAIDGAYWVFTMISTTGYGDIVPENLRDTVIALFGMLLGPATFSLLIAYVVNFIFSNDIISMELQSTESHRSICLAYLKRLKAEDDNRYVNQSVHSRHHHRPLTDFEIRGDLDRIVSLSNIGSESLDHIKTLVCGELLRRSRLLRNQSESFVNSAVRSLRQLLYLKNAMIISRANGHRSMGVYFIMSGTVHLNMSSSVCCRRFAGDHFGEESLLMGAGALSMEDDEEDSLVIDSAKAMKDVDIWLLPEHELCSILKSEQVSLTSVVQPRNKRTSKPIRVVSRSLSLLQRIQQRGSSLRSRISIYFSRIVVDVWTYLVRVAPLFYAVIIPYRIAFSCSDRFPSLVELFLNYLIDGCCLLFIVGDYLIMQRQQKLYNYLFVWIAMIAIIPLEMLTFAKITQQGNGLLMTQLFYMLRINKTLLCIAPPSLQRLYEVSTYLFPRQQESEKSQAPKKQSFISKLAYHACSSAIVLLVVANACANIFFLIARHEDHHHRHNWLSEYLDYSGWSAAYCGNENLYNSSLYYVIALYWSMTFLTTTGYGDIYPVSNTERLVNTIFYGCGAIVFAMAFSNLTTVYSEENSARENHLERVKLMERVLNFENADQDDQQKAEEALTLQWKHFRGQELATLRTSLGYQRYHRLMSDLLLPSLNQNFLFSRLNTDFLEAVTATMTLHVLPKGTIIVSSGVLVNDLLILVDGEAVFDNRDQGHNHVVHNHDAVSNVNESTQRACNKYSNTWRRGRANGRQEYTRQQEGLILFSEFIQRNASACTVWTSKESCIALISFSSFFDLASKYQVLPVLMRCLRTVSQHDLVKQSTAEMVRHYKFNRMKIKIDKIVPILLAAKHKGSMRSIELVMNLLSLLMCFLSLVQVAISPTLLLMIPFDVHYKMDYAAKLFVWTALVVEAVISLLTVVHVAMQMYKNRSHSVTIQPSLSNQGMSTVAVSSSAATGRIMLELLCSFPFGLLVWLADPANLSSFLLAKIVCIIPTFFILSQSLYHLYQLRDGSPLHSHSTKIRWWHWQLPCSSSVMLVIIIFLYTAHFFACLLVGISLNSKDSEQRHDYLSALFWSLYTLSTVGYGSVSLRGKAQLILAIIALLSASFFCSILSAGINDSVDRIVNKNATSRRLKCAIESYESSNRSSASNENTKGDVKNNARQAIDEYFTFLNTHFDGRLYDAAYSSIPLFSRYRLFHDCHAVLRASRTIQMICHPNQMEGVVHSICRVFQPYYGGRDEVLLRRGYKTDENEEHIYLLRKGSVVCTEETRMQHGDSLAGDRANKKQLVHTFEMQSIINDYHPVCVMDTLNDTVLAGVESVEMQAAELSECMSVVVWCNGRCWASTSSTSHQLQGRDNSTYSYATFTLLSEDSSIWKCIQFPRWPPSNISPDRLEFHVYLSHHQDIYYECCSSTVDLNQQGREQHDSTVQYDHSCDAALPASLQLGESEATLTAESFGSGIVRLRKKKKPIMPNESHQPRLSRAPVKPKLWSNKLSSWFSSSFKRANTTNRAEAYESGSDTSDNSEEEESLKSTPNNSLKTKCSHHAGATRSILDAVKLFSLSSLESGSINNTSSAFHTLSTPLNTQGEHITSALSAANDDDNSAVTTTHSSVDKEGMTNEYGMTTDLVLVNLDGRVGRCSIKIKLNSEGVNISDFKEQESDMVARVWSYQCTEPCHLLRLHAKDREEIVRSYAAIQGNWKVKDRFCGVKS